MEKLKELYNFLEQYKSVAVAFSAGVDSTLLAYVAGEVLGEKCLLLTVSSPLISGSEIDEATVVAKRMGLRHSILKSNIIEIPEFYKNTRNRCYICKKKIISQIKETASAQNYEVIMEGSNVDDINDYRPGLKALEEMNIVSPFIRLNFKKDEIRNYSKKLGLKTASKPSNACLASRIPYYEIITKEKLKKVETAENAIRMIGFHQFRVRCRGELACIEFSPEEMSGAWSKKELLYNLCRDTGFLYVAIDIRGYRCGSLNETLQIDALKPE